MEYYLFLENEQKGPYTLNQLKSMWRAGSITGNTLYWQEGFDEWLPLSSMLHTLEPHPIAPTKTKDSSSGWGLVLFTTGIIIVSSAIAWHFLDPASLNKVIQKTQGKINATVNNLGAAFPVGRYKCIVKVQGETKLWIETDVLVLDANSEFTCTKTESDYTYSNGTSVPYANTDKAESIVQGKWRFENNQLQVTLDDESKKKVKDLLFISELRYDKPWSLVKNGTRVIEWKQPEYSANVPGENFEWQVLQNTAQ